MAINAFIPARGGSKRLPRKNILDLAGKPMLAYPIEAARTSGLFDRIVVSTEDAEIANVAKEYGASVIERPADIAGDRSTVAEVCIHALESDPSTELFCCLYPTSVMLKPSSIAAGYRILAEDQTAQFVMGVSEYEHAPVQALKADEKGNLSYMWPEWRGRQSQSYPRLVVSNGTFYWARRKAFLDEKSFYGPGLRGFTVSPTEVSDIDTLEDLARLRLRLAN